MGVPSSVAITAAPTRIPVTVLKDAPFAYNQIMPGFAMLQLPSESLLSRQENSPAYGIDPSQYSRDQCLSILQSLHTQDGLPPPALVGSFMEPSKDVKAFRQVVWSDSRQLNQSKNEFPWEATYMVISNPVPMEACQLPSSPDPSQSKSQMKAPESSQADIFAEDLRLEAADLIKKGATGVKYFPEGPYIEWGKNGTIHHKGVDKEHRMTGLW
jgi:hypothetical protein